MGLLQVEKPRPIKVGNRPACLVGAVGPGAPFPMGLTAQYASQPASDESVFRAECLVVAMFEVVKPAPQRPGYVSDGLGHAASRGSLGLRPDRIFEFLEAFAARPALASLEVIARKSKPSLRSSTSRVLAGAASGRLIDSVRSFTRTSAELEARLPA
jgi:hypothetical protein